WRTALYGIDRLYTDVEADPALRRALYLSARDGYLSEHRPSPGLVRRLGDRFRNERSKLDALLADDFSSASPMLVRATAAVRRRSERLASIVADLRQLERDDRLTLPLARMVPSFAHMFAIRLLRSAAREHELVLYDFLARLYEARAARARARTGP